MTLDTRKVSKKQIDAMADHYDMDSQTVLIPVATEEGPTQAGSPIPDQSASVADSAENVDNDGLKWLGVFGGLDMSEFIENSPFPMPQEMQEKFYAVIDQKITSIAKRDKLAEFNRVHGLLAASGLDVDLIYDLLEVGKIRFHAVNSKDGKLSAMCLIVKWSENVGDMIDGFQPTVSYERSFLTLGNRTVAADTKTAKSAKARAKARIDGYDFIGKLANDSELIVKTPARTTATKYQGLTDQLFPNFTGGDHNPLSFSKVFAPWYRLVYLASITPRPNTEIVATEANDNWLAFLTSDQTEPIE